MRREHRFVLARLEADGRVIDAGSVTATGSSVIAALEVVLRRDSAGLRILQPVPGVALAYCGGSWWLCARQGG